MRYLLLGCLLLVHAVRAQSPAAAFQRCIFKTDGTGKSCGVRLSMAYPCAWTPTDGSKAGIVKQFTDDASDEVLVATLGIGPVKPGSPAGIDALVREQGDNSQFPKGATLISARKLRLAGMDCAETVVRLTQNLLVKRICIYMLNYQFLYKGNKVMIQYALGAAGEAGARRLYNRYGDICRELVAATVFMP